MELQLADLTQLQKQKEKVFYIVLYFMIVTIKE